MYEEAINTLTELMDKYPAVFKIGIVAKDNIVINYDEKNNSHKVNFSNSVEMLEWLETKYK